MKKYIVPEIEIEEISSEDIITASAGSSVNSLKAPGPISAENDGKGGLDISGDVNDIF